MPLARGNILIDGGRKIVAEFIARERLSAIIRTNDERVAREAIQAAVNGGFRILEFTLTTPGALALISEFRDKENLVIGAGTVLSVDQVHEAKAAGAQFVVSPVCDGDVIAEAGRQDMVCIPGGSTPTELEKAHRLGADFVKLFPAPAGDVEFVHSVRAPLPHLRLFPTNGITVENFIDYLSAGCAGVGFARWLFDPADLAAGRFAAIENRAGSVIRRFNDWRGPADSG
jgi:2-dehydro-3-deoxyphosphogluconate aldolase / (4S)-4-hydroxy-2-oxoglutarate aldolase